MGKRARRRPKRLAEKLSRIRESLGLSQSDMLKLLGAEDEIDYTAISKYELGRNEPSLITLLRYARVVGVHVEILIDDDLDLPSKLPSSKKSEGVRRRARTAS
jgi:transcriptional regulator with XRE-family HTH domain